jgi:hypothetical protein
MKTVYDLCIPRKEVLEGELREDIFAARLKDVMDGKAEYVYGDPDVFFDNTYPTAGLKTLLSDAMGRLTGNAVGKNAIIRLETAFGGGKTHNLIALYHCVNGNAKDNDIQELIGKENQVPKPGEIKIAGVVGSDLDPTYGISHPEDNLKTFTLWGELAYQLGGKEGYELIKDSDENTKAAPGTGLFEALVGDQATLIMIDEIARHLRSAIAVPTLTKKSNLAEQSVAFLMSLLEFAASKERCLVVITLADETSAFAEQTEMVRQAISETKNISARQERVLTPTDEDEISSIVTHRLFKTIDREKAEPVFDAYINYYRQLIDKNAELPPRCMGADYKKELRNAYPFHPELLSTLNRKTATIPNFNQTRGALRLLAWTVRSLWENKIDKLWLIHLHHIDLSEEQIVEDLTSKLDRPKFRQVVQADIVSVMKGIPAHAQTVDEALIASGKPPYAQRLATTIFINSLTQGVASGIDPANLMLCLIEPDRSGGGDEPGVIKRQLEKLYHAPAFFLEYDGHIHRFKTEPSLEKIILDEASHVPITRAKNEIEERIKKIWKKGYLKLIYFPNEPLDVDDDADLPKLAIMHFDATKTSVTANETPELVKRIIQFSGSMESFRIYQNNVLFLVADADQIDHMIWVARRYLAFERIMEPSRLAEFNEEQKKEIKKLKDAAELDTRIAITKSYRHLYYPSHDAHKTDNYLQHETLQAQDQGDVDKDQSNVILRVLHNLDKVIKADDNVRSAAWLKSKAWDINQKEMTTEELRKAFARKISLKILLDNGQLRKMIENGVKTGVWIYYDSRQQYGYDQDVPPPAWEISDEAILYSPEEAQRLNIQIKGKSSSQFSPVAGEDQSGIPPVDICPVCGNPVNQCTCGADITQGKPQKISGEGVEAQAFQQVLDQCQEHQIEKLDRLFITIDSSGKLAASATRALGLAIPQFGKGRFFVEQKVHANFATTHEREEFEQEFIGTWERYKRLKNVVDAFGNEADEYKIKMRIKAEFENGLEVNGDQFLMIRDILVNLDVGLVLVEGVPYYEDD